MKSGLALLLSILAFIGAPPIAYGKELSGREIQHVRQVAADFGNCVITRSSPVARAVILGNLGEDEIKASAYRLIDGNCLVKATNGLGGQMRFTGDLFRYTMASALIRNDYPAETNFDFSAVASLDHWQPKPIEPALVGGSSRKAKKAAEDFAEGQNISALSRFGECVSRNNPNDVHKLLLSEVGSASETAVFAQLQLSLSECLGDGQIKFGREVLRGLLALNFYRLAGPPHGAAVATLKVKN